MASSQTKSNLEGNTAPNKSQLWSKIIDFGNGVLDFGREILDFIKANPVLAATVAGTFVVAPPVLYDAVNAQDSAADVAFHGLDSDQQVVLNHFIDKTSDLLDPTTLDSSSNSLNDNTRRSLKANSFTALRNLDGIGKGRLLRFLAEYELIEANSPELSLAGADLREIDLEDAWLPDINLHRVYMMNGNLVRTNLTRANLIDATLTGTDFTGANLTDAQIDVEQAVKEGAIFCDAILPDGETYEC
jgi:uncharacterized protein YjbI with pentapeptide repeats